MPKPRRARWILKGVALLAILGVAGLAVMSIIIFQAGAEFVRRIKVGETLVPLLLLQYFLAIQLSGSLWGAASFWAMLVVTLSNKIRTKPPKFQIST